MTSVPEPPPLLPATEADLAAWATYAAALRDAGDPRGSLMELDLSLPALVDREQLKAFHHAGHRLCRVRPATPTTWSLAHARDLAIYPSSGYPWQVAARSPDPGTFANAHDFLRSPPGSRVEQLTTLWPTSDDERPWRRLMRALPATCTTIALLHQRRTVPPGDLFASLPATIRHVRIIRNRDRSQAWLALVDDRFDVVELDTSYLSEEDLSLLADVFARTSRVRLRANVIVGPLRGLDRVVAGHPGDPVLAFGDGSVVVLQSWTLDELQVHYGRVPIRAQLARMLPERHSIGVREVTTTSSGTFAREHRIESSHHYADLVRRGTAWTLRGSREYDDFAPADGPDTRRRHETAHNGGVLGESEIVPIRDGDRLRFDGVECTFVDRAARAIT